MILGGLAGLLLQGIGSAAASKVLPADTRPAFLQTGRERREKQEQRTVLDEQRLKNAVPLIQLTMTRMAGAANPEESSFFEQSAIRAIEDIPHSEQLIASLGLARRTPQDFAREAEKRRAEDQERASAMLRAQLQDAAIRHVMERRQGRGIGAESGRPPDPSRTVISETARPEDLAAAGLSEAARFRAGRQEREQAREREARLNTRIRDIITGDGSAEDKMGAMALVDGMTTEERIRLFETAEGIKNRKQAAAEELRFRAIQALGSLGLAEFATDLVELMARGLKTGHFDPLLGNLARTSGLNRETLAQRVSAFKELSSLDKKLTDRAFLETLVHTDDPSDVGLVQNWNINVAELAFAASGGDPVQAEQTFIRYALVLAEESGFFGDEFRLPVRLGRFLQLKADPDTGAGVKLRDNADSVLTFAAAGFEVANGRFMPTRPEQRPDALLRPFGEDPAAADPGLAPEPGITPTAPVTPVQPPTATRPLSTLGVLEKAFRAPLKSPGVQALRRAFRPTPEELRKKKEAREDEARRHREFLERVHGIKPSPKR